MTLTFAFECYGDEDVYHFLRDHCRLALRKFHGFGQGEVVNEVLVRRRADIGMVDEDPGKPSHRERDNTDIVESTIDVEVRQRGDRHLVLLRPTLEECFLRGMALVKLKSGLPERPSDLHALLGVPNRAKHARFRDELAALYRASRDRGIATFVTKLDEIVRSRM